LFSCSVSTTGKQKDFPHPFSIEEKIPATNRVQVELGKALKTFFADVRHIQKDLREFSFDECGHGSSGQIVQISQNLDHVLGTLKSGVSSAVRIHKMDRRASLGNVAKR